MTAIENTALGRLDKEGRLLNAVLKSETTKPGRFGFRGDIALKFQSQVADEKRPPDYSIEQVLTRWIFDRDAVGDDELEGAKTMIVETICRGLERDSGAASAAAASQSA